MEYKKTMYPAIGDTLFFLFKFFQFKIGQNFNLQMPKLL